MAENETPQSENAAAEEQLQIASRLQLKWLKKMEELIDGGTITSTDMATLARVLSQNGWSLDPARLPKNLRDKLTKHVAFDAAEGDERGKLRLVNEK